MTANPLKVWRDTEKLSLDKAGELFGVSGMTFYRWERGDCLPRKKQWPKIEEATGIAPSEIVGHMAEASQ